MSVFAGIVSSSGTDVPAQDWTLVGVDAIEASPSDELTVLGGVLSYSSVKFIADLDSAGTQTLRIIFPQAVSDCDWFAIRINENGLFDTGILSSSTVAPPGTGIHVPLDSAGRYLIVGEFSPSDIPGEYGKVSIDVQRTNDGTDYEMTTFHGFVNVVAPWTTADFTMTSSVATGLKAGSRLSVYSSPASVTG